MSNYRTSMGDGRRVEMTADEIRRDIAAGSEDAADRGRIPPLTQEEQDRLYELFTNRSRVVGVEPGNEVVMSTDGGNIRLIADEGNCGIGIPIGRLDGFLVQERAFAFDSMELGHIDYSFKAVKPIFAQEQQDMEQILLSTIVPVLYGSMANLGLYYRPDGPCGNPSDLLPRGQVKEALEAQEEAVELAARDMIFIGSKMSDAGADGINFDTIGAAGDADFLATLKAIEELKRTTNLGVEVGMAGEFVLGMHGGLEYKGKRLAGLFPHEQVKLVEEAGGDIFGPVVNTNTGRSTPWNVSRATTFVKACSEVAQIPIHPNVGMGVCGVPTLATPPVDAVCRVSVALVEIGKADGL